MSPVRKAEECGRQDCWVHGVCMYPLSCGPQECAAEQQVTVRPHIVGGQFQSDKYPTCPAGKVPLSVKDPTAQDLLWTYAQRRRSVDAEFADDLEFALDNAGYVSAPESFRVQIARAADALPVDHGAEALVDGFMARALPVGPYRKLTSPPSAEALRGLQLMRRHLDEDGHDWSEGTDMADVDAACTWLDRNAQAGK